MTNEAESRDPYEVVLADLHAQRDRIDQVIASLTAFRGGFTPGGSAYTPPDNDGPPAIEETAGMFLGMSIPEAVKKLLASRKRTMNNVEIARELKAGGLVLTSNDPVNVIGSVITRRFKDVGDVVKVGRGIWGLKEWYPGRTFKHTPQARTVKPSVDVAEPTAGPEMETPDEAAAPIVDVAA